MCIARFGSTATASVDQTEDLSPQSSPFRAPWIGKDVRNKRVSDRVLFPSPAPHEFPAKKANPKGLAFLLFGQAAFHSAERTKAGLSFSRFQLNY
jgi:hypothetical protein